MRAFYNEFDKHAAAWLRELGAQGHITEGVVDERSITELGADDVAGHRRVHLFAGIGGWDYALRLAGWPDDEPVWTGSCPCQPFSNAGRRRGTSDERHLWPHFARLVRECRPATIFGEQVASKAGRAWFATVRADLEAMGYAVGGADLCAAGVGAPHIRQRIYFVAHDASIRRERSGGAWRGRTGLEDGGDAERVAYSDGGDSGDGGLQRGGEHRLQPQDGGVGGGSVADAVRSGRAEGRTVAGNGPAPRGGGAVRGSVAHTSSARPAELGGRRDEPARPAPAGFWSDCHWLPCRDGKARPVEPGTFPLAHGIPQGLGRGEPGMAGVGRRARTNRVLRLRGYGNAIVPEVAAQFIRSAIEAINP